MAELKEKEKKSWSLEDSKRHKERMKRLREGIERDCSLTEETPSIRRESRTVSRVTSRRPGWPAQAVGIPRDSFKRRPRSSKQVEDSFKRRPRGQPKKKTKTAYSTVSLVELELFLECHLFHVSIIGDLFAISFGGDLFLILSYASTCHSSNAFREDPLLHSSSMFDRFSHDFGFMNNTSIKLIVVGFGLVAALFDIQHDKCLGKFVEKQRSLKNARLIFPEELGDDRQGLESLTYPPHSQEGSRFSSNTNYRVGTSREK
ncbi:hypothetical protein M9H77_11075 [Catharanthus roseus]|uniref:Uncharacterized protein n=1 Tax=Catharanthus roseus TaxID=4058 RepID=A0ACC0BDI4_CATRO|nr:hypothetical protein M9H77_11075 [Catharanthus roseus]